MSNSGRLLVVLFVAASALQAQTATTGVISGTVSDSSGAVAPGAVVEAQHLGTNALQTQTTNESGHYIFSNLSPGPYRLTATQIGFRAATVPEVSPTTG
jgi:hypothetical protein